MDDYGESRSMRETGSDMEAELRQRIDDLKAANDALLDGHGKMSIAYLSLRLGRLEDERIADARKLRIRVESLERLVKELREGLNQSKESNAEIAERVERASRVVKGLKLDIDSLKESEGAE